MKRVGGIMNTQSNLALLDSVLNAISKKAMPIFTPQGRATVEINGDKTCDAADIYAFLEDGTCVASLHISLAEIPPV
jgi:hypothetical protein